MNSKLFLATIIFIATLGLSFYTLQRFAREQKFASLAHEHSDAQEGADGDSFFYKTIGNLPAEATAPSQGLATHGELEFFRYTLELQQLDSQAAADEALDALRSKGLEAYYTPFHAGQKVVFRIRKGVFSDLKKAELAQADLLTKYQVNAKIVQLQ